MDSRFEPEREWVANQPQLVLTSFGPDQLVEYYELEKLCYELWRTSAQLRIAGKGADVEVDGIGPEYLHDVRSTELDRTVMSYDKRADEHAAFDVSSTGVVFDDLEAQKRGTPLPFLNVRGADATALLGRGGAAFGLSTQRPFISNYLWALCDLTAFYRNHRAFAASFRRTHGVSLAAVVGAFSALGRSWASMWIAGPDAFCRDWQRAYHGPTSAASALDTLAGLAKMASGTLATSDDCLTPDAMREAARFLLLTPRNRDGIDLLYPGPHYVFLPCRPNEVFVDLAWASRRLYDLFLGVRLPDQNFKGDALEIAVRGAKSELPPRGCEAPDGERRQFDAAFRRGRRLVVVECRAFSRSIGFERGDTRAIRYRTERLDRGLFDVDEKARWLSRNPRGKNYDVEGCNEIVPIVVTPFVEYIPSVERRWWITESVPRALAPGEFRAALEGGVFDGDVWNRVAIG